MSSGTRYQPDAFRRMSSAIEPRVFDKIGRLGMSPRQLEINRRWSLYCCAQYDVRSTDWDGSKRPDGIEREAIARAGFIPPGFYDPGNQMAELPLKFRRPATPYHLAKVITDRFTGLLFSERRHPALNAEGDPATEDWVGAVSDVARLWPAMIKARTYGGATGTVVTGFQFQNGKPLVEVHDPRWIIPAFRDRITHVLASIEKRYMYPVEIRDQETGLWVTEWMWYRRIIDEDADVVFAPAPVGDGEEPQWVVQEAVQHGLGFCPVVWTQNMPVDDDIDGEPDCHGIWDLSESIDTLLSQAHRGTVMNCDPTLVVVSTDDLGALKKGSGTAVKLTNGSANYLEISGTGPAAARELASELRSYALEIAQCVLDHPDVAGRTATEVERVYSSMLAKADVLREQYGQRLVIPLMEMMIKAAHKLGEPRVDQETGSLTRYSLSLPPRLDEKTGQRVPRALGQPDTQISISWPGYFEPSLADAQQAAAAASTAKMAGILDDENAAKFVSSYFHIDDVQAMLARAQEQKKAEAAAMESDLLRGMGGEQLPGEQKPGGVG